MTSLPNHPVLDWKSGLLGRRRVVVGMSGGVDSSVAAWRLKEAGLEVTGMFMKNWEDEDDSEYCSTRQDFLDAAAAADVLGIELQAVNFSAEYKERVFAEFLREYQAGRTPNPDVLCNAEIKFKAFLDHALATGAELIATGHYAQLAHGPQVQLIRAADAGKDQTYFLHRLSQDQLARTVFPIGDLQKSAVRQIAQKIGLGNAAKKDSTGICFIGERPFREFLNRYLPKAPGPMKTPEGRVVGTHMGLAFYTLGQRKGLGLGGDKAGIDQPWFVVEKDMAANALIVAQGHDHPGLMSHQLNAIDASWVGGLGPELAGQLTDQLPSQQITAKTRYRQPDSACSLLALDQTAKTFSLGFPEPQWAVTPGQSAVLYQGPVCLGGGIISARSP
jgi:tRNA-uridine 2-sulfurtransferase